MANLRMLWHLDEEEFALSRLTGEPIRGPMVPHGPLTTLKHPDWPAAPAERPVPELPGLPEPKLDSVEMAI